MSQSDYDRLESQRDGNGMPEVPTYDPREGPPQVGAFWVLLFMAIIIACWVGVYRNSKRPPKMNPHPLMVHQIQHNMLKPAHDSTIAVFRTPGGELVEVLITPAGISPSVNGYQIGSWSLVTPRADITNRFRATPPPSTNKNHHCTYTDRHGIVHRWSITQEHYNKSFKRYGKPLGDL